jgi:hypothetical protein
MNFAKTSALLLVLFLFTGCGPAPAKLVPVSGKITIQGAPLPWGTITLYPDTTKGNSSTLQPFGTVAPDGSYSLNTDGKPGAPLGAYVVTISAAKPSTPGEYKPPEWAASQDYLDRSKSGLSLTVVESPAAGAYDLALTKK